MSIKKEVQVAVESNDKIKVQSVLETLINQDKDLPEFEFEQNLNYAAGELSNNNIELFDEDNSDMDLNTPKENWNTDLWQTTRSKLKYNFSKEKAEFIIKIMKYLRQKGVPEFQPISKSSSSEHSDTILVAVAAVVLCAVLAFVFFRKNK